MPTRKKGPQATKKTARKTKKTTKARKVGGVETGPVPPYGIPIRKAIARGNKKEMKDLATSSRKWLAEVESALEQLESSIKKPGS